MKNKIFSNYSKEYNNFLIRVVFVSVLVAGVAAIFFSMVLNVSDAASRGVELNPVWLIGRYPIFLIATGLITFFGAVIGGYVLADWLWFDLVHGDFTEQGAIKKGSQVGLILAVGMTYIGVVSWYPKVMGALEGMAVLPFVALFSYVAGRLIGQQVYKRAKLPVSFAYDHSFSLNNLYDSRRYAFRMNFILQFTALTFASILIYALNAQGVITSGSIKPWNFFDRWDYASFLLAMWMVMFPFAGYFTAQRIAVAILETRMNKQSAFNLGLLIGVLFGLIVSLGLSTSFIGSIHWWKLQYSLLCPILYGCMNAYTAVRVWGQLQNSENNTEIKE